MKNKMTVMALALLALVFTTVNAHALSELKSNSLDLRGSTSGSQRISPPATGGVDLVLPAADGSAGDAMITDGAGNLSFSSVSSWTKYTAAATDFTAAASSEAITLFTLAENEVIEAVVIKHSTAFSGGTSTAVTVAVGPSGDQDKYASDFDVFQAVGATVFQISGSLGLESFGAGTAIEIQATATGDTLDNVSSGSVDVWVKTSLLSAET